MLFHGRWQENEHNNVLELRVAILLLRHLARSSQNWNTKTLIFIDSLVVLGILCKGRSPLRTF